MQSIYMDNASTSFPKAPGVSAAMARFIDENGMNVFRGGYAAAYQAEEATLRLRESLRDIFDAESAECAILTSGATYGLNMVFRGALKSGDHVLVSPFEHNSVMRPLNSIAGVLVETLPCGADGTPDPSGLAGRIRPNTALVACTYASNVSGAVMPIKELGGLCRERGIPFVVDASQAVGHLPISCAKEHIDALVFSAHKGLLGPQGIGAALLSRGFAERLAPFATGGTGSMSDMQTQPTVLPDKLEAGTPNLPGCYGFLAGLDYWRAHAEAIMAREKALLRRLTDGLGDVSGIRVPGQSDSRRHICVVSVDFIGRDNAEMALRLEREHGILTRCGLHCAPAAHIALGTYPRGTVRLSPGWRTTDEEIDATVSAVRRLAGGR